MRKNSIGREILFLIATGGILTLTVILAGPNVLKILKAVKRDYDRFSKERIKRALRELERREIVSLQKQGYETYIKLTPEGERQILKYKIDEMKLRRSKHWDKKWRLVIFDIPEQLKKNRNAFSLTLRRVGAYPFQKSVFAYPDDCEDDIRFLTELYGVHPFVKYAEISRIDSEKILKHHFKIYI